MFRIRGRTDAELQFADRKVWAKLEWEWNEPREDSVGELAKLAEAAHGCEVCIFIGYSQTKHHEANLEKIKTAWVGVEKPLLVILVTFESEGSGATSIDSIPTLATRMGCYWCAISRHCLGVCRTRAGTLRPALQVRLQLDILNVAPHCHPVQLGNAVNGS